MRRIAAISVISAALAITGGTALAVNRSTPATVSASAPPASTVAPKGAPSPGASRHDMLTDVLAKLVANGTITQKQADSIAAQMKVARDKHRAERGSGRKHSPDASFGAIRSYLSDITGSVAKAIGITPDALRAELKHGKSLADVATAHGVDPAKVSAALEAEANARIDDLVAKGRLTADQAVTAKSWVGKVVEAVVNGKTGDFARFGGRGFGAHRKGPDEAGGPPSMPAPPPSLAPDVPATPAQPPSSTAPTTVPATPDTTAAPSTTAAG